MEEKFFVKTTKSSVELSADQKVKLNRRGNELFNSGNIEMAAKIFITTGYSSGLTRIGDYYYDNNQKLTALKYYSFANNKNNVDILVGELANIIRMMLD